MRGNRDWRQGQVGVGSQHCARQGVFTFSWDLTTDVSTAYFPRLLQTSFHRRLKTTTSTSCLKISERPPLWGTVLHPFPAAYPTTSPTPRAGASNVSALSPSQAITPHHGIGSAVWWAGPLPLGLWIWLISIKTHGSLFHAWWASVPGYLRPAGVEKEGSKVLTCKWSRFNVKSSIEELLFLAASSWLQMHAHTLENLTSASSLPTLGPCTCAYPRSPHRGVSTRSPYRCWVVVSSPFYRRCEVAHPTSHSPWRAEMQNCGLHLSPYCLGAEGWRRLRFVSQRAPPPRTRMCKGARVWCALP